MINNKEKKLEKEVGSILYVIRNDEIDEGIDVLSASLSSAIIAANKAGLFNEEDLDKFFNELKNRIRKTLSNKHTIIRR